MKQKYDIYIRSSIRSMFDKEPNKSGLVNELLGHHYQLKIAAEKNPYPSKLIEKAEEASQKIHNKRIIKTKKDAEQAFLVDKKKVGTPETSIRPITYKKTQNWGA